MFAIRELLASFDQGDQVRGVEFRHRASAATSNLKASARPAFRESAPLVLRIRGLTVENADSIALDVRRWIQY